MNRRHVAERGFAAAAASSSKTSSKPSVLSQYRNFSSSSSSSSSSTVTIAPGSAGAAFLGAQTASAAKKVVASSAAAAAGLVSPIARNMTAAQSTALGVWLAGCSAWVYSMVVLGGVTRLTRSGLSMTEWRFLGEKYPRTLEDWEREFDKYRASPEFQKVNRSMNLDEFQFIYFMEYAHRMWGRVLGVVFLVPAAAFAARGALSANGVVGPRLALLGSMGAAQGFVGWWMVRSGLKHENFGEHDVPRVSPYRLAAHLTSAFAIYTGLLWSSLGLLQPAIATNAATDAMKVIRGRVTPVAALIAVTAVSGAFVAGNDAGRAYNTFPLMEGRIVPEHYFEALTPWWRNAFEHTATVQFDHRVLAVSTLTAVSALWAITAGPLASPAIAAALSPSATFRMHALLALAWGQVGLGVSTLLHAVPVELGSAHQAGALALMSVAVAVVHSVRAGPAGAGAVRAAVKKAL
ncbi:cytochrome c oxidase assembly protein COX15 [Pseudoscourfieldia marina]